MEIDKPPFSSSSSQHLHGGGGGVGVGGGGGLPLPPPSTTRYFSSSGASMAMSLPSPTATLESGNNLINPDNYTSDGNGNVNGNGFSYDISGMSDLPTKGLFGHRRAHSEILSLPDDISFDSDLGVVGSGSAAANADGPSFSDETEEDLFSMFMDMEKFGSCSTATSSGEPSSSVPPPPLGSGFQMDNSMMGFTDRPRIRHHHSQSMDGSTSIKSELLISGSEGPSFTENKKAISSSKLADLALVDPKRAKRIWANRQSAARSKERKLRYISELERKVQTLQTEATTLSTQLNMLQRDTSGLTVENSELKLRLQTMEQQVNLQDALNNALRDELQRLKVITGQAITGVGSLMNFGSTHRSNQPFYPNNQTMHGVLAAHQFQQLQIQSQQSLQLQQQQLQQQQTGDIKLKGSLSSVSHRDDSFSCPPISASPDSLSTVPPVSTAAATTSPATSWGLETQRFS
ncbi:bZIP transcription factor [Thalictrum thalictroides]|uniref:BZIP transcription factor n=1 Tax=Thalictrum thalictroides TaxID=46969 RepID=A0A7J6VGW3_THATH|nr:bZIP transcription factor [Thalictrum thalictroides]